MSVGAGAKGFIVTENAGAQILEYLLVTHRKTGPAVRLAYYNSAIVLEYKNDIIQNVQPYIPKVPI